MVNHFVVTLTTTGTVLNSGLSGVCVTDLLKELHISADPANTHVAYIGGSQVAPTSSVYGIIVPLPPSNVPAAPIVLRAVSLGDLFVLGTAGEKLHLLAVM